MDRHTPWNEIIQAICEFRPGFADDIVGANKSEIDRLEEVVGLPLLPEYREFLGWMGHGLGGIEIATSDFDITTIHRFYSDSEYRPQSDLIVIGEQQDDETAYDVCLSCKEGQEGRVIRVLFSDEQQPDGTYRLVGDRDPKPYDESLSLQALVFRLAFYQFRLLEFGGTTHMFVRDRDVTSGRDLALVEEVFKKFGFRKHRLFDAWTNFYESDNAVLVYRFPSGKGTQFFLSIQDPSSLKRFKATVKDRLDMREA